MSRTLSPRSLRGVTTLQALALAPPVFAAYWAAPVTPPGALAVAVVTAVLWEIVFAGVRRRAFTVHGMTTGLAVALFLPTDVVLWQLCVAVSLGVVFGELVFGGRGFGFVSPAALSLSFLIVAFPDVAFAAPTTAVALAVVPGLALLIVGGLLAPSILLGVFFSALAVFALTGHVADPASLAVALSVGAVFLIADPTASSITAPGRWGQGLLAGVFVVVFSPAGTATPEAVVAAALLTSVFAPLIDHGVILLHAATHRYRG